MEQYMLNRKALTTLQQSDTKLFRTQRIERLTRLCAVYEKRLAARISREFK